MLLLSALKSVQYDYSGSAWKHHTPAVCSQVSKGLQMQMPFSKRVNHHPKLLPTFVVKPQQWTVLHAQFRYTNSWRSSLTGLGLSGIHCSVYHHILVKICTRRKFTLPLLWIFLWIFSKLLKFTGRLAAALALTLYIRDIFQQPTPSFGLKYTQINHLNIKLDTEFCSF